MIVQSKKDLLKLQRVGAIVANCLQFMLSQVEPGLSTSELDAMGRAFLKEAGARSAPQVMYNFPGATCISLNQVAAHGIPCAKDVIKTGDLVNIDVSAVLDGYFADTGGTLVVPPGEHLHEKLCTATKRALDRCLEQVRADAPINIIGKTIEKEAKGSGFRVIRNLCGHGIGRLLHEEPEHITSFYNPRDKRILVENMVVAIEPFLSTGTELSDDGDDGWSLLNKSGCVSAQFEHSLVITKTSPIVLTLPT